MAKQTILIVDDDRLSIEILGEALGDDYEILFAMTGQEALELAFGRSPDLILLDLVLPDMSGYSVCRSLKNHGPSRDIPVIFVTAMGDTEQESIGLELGAVDYIAKPFNPAIVRLRVRNHLESKLQRDTLAVRNAELHEAISKIKLLGGLIPICSSCKKIRDDRGYWEQVEVYLKKHSEADITSGICPQCAAKGTRRPPKETSAEQKGARDTPVEPTRRDDGS